VRGKSGIVLTRLLFCKTAGPDCFCLSAVNPCLSATYCFQPAPYFRYLSAFLCHHSKMVSLSVSACRLSLRQRTAASAQSSLAAGREALPARWPASPPAAISGTPWTPATPDASTAPDLPANGRRYLQHGLGSSSLARGDAAASCSLPCQAPREVLGSSARRCSGDPCARCRFLPGLRVCRFLEAVVAHPVLMVLWVVLNLLCSCLVDGVTARSGNGTAG